MTIIPWGEASVNSDGSLPRRVGVFERALAQGVPYDLPDIDLPRSTGSQPLNQHLIESPVHAARIDSRASSIPGRTCECT